MKCIHNLFQMSRVQSL